ncbi:MAG TPA: hypothetical protein VKX17_27045 [Planctomycetota bacterium]|nr:hypothetical protein [Planctomycetota bacterium]
MSKNEILAELPKLDDQDRRDIWLWLSEMEELTDEERENDALTPDQVALVEARIAEHERDPQSAIPLNEFVARMNRRIGS